MSNPFTDQKLKEGIESGNYPLLKNLQKCTVPALSSQPIKVYGKKQIILGNPIAKSNAYNIVTIKPKDPLKKSFSSLAKTKQLKEYEKSFWAQCNIYRNAKINVQFKIEVDVFFARANSDLDNVAKGTMDSLAECNAITNDRLCYELVMRKHVDAGNPRIEFVITPLNS